MRGIRAPIGKRLGLDLLLIASIAAVLTTVHVLVPSPLREQLALRPADPQWYTLQTAAYVHASFDHLQANLIGYLLAVSYAYWLCLYLERRQWFWQTTIGLLVITPVVVNSANVVLYGTYLPDIDGVARGFSGVVAAFAGFLLVSFLAAIREAHTAQLAQAVGVGLILLLLLLIDTVYARTVRPIVAGLVAFGACVQAAPLLYHRDWGTVVHARSREQLLFQIAGASFIILILTILTLQMFPAELVLDNAFVNVFAHGIGFVFGLVLPSVTLLYPE
jgi:membrane associated rhomboid family serine protease